ncbi:MAG: DUF4442 domain-containing protein [Saprospiraceae bacterium]|nr:DUF4442 domain-containing protein [Saprospiraceae bacterium]
MTPASFQQLVNTPWRMRLFMLWKLPAAWFMGVSIRHCDGERAVMRLPYRWRSQNPFRSIYFAAQCAAGEMSTGMLALMHLQGKAAVSMLVTKVEAEFLKKASATLLFTCEDGKALEASIQQALETGEPQMFRATSIGTLPDGTEAARIWITWSFKRKGA